MADEKVENLTHGFNIASGGHNHALDYIGSHMNEQQVKDMVHIAKSGHGADFMVTHNGQSTNYELKHHDGKLEIHKVQHI